MSKSQKTTGKLSGRPWLKTFIGIAAVLIVLYTASSFFLNRYTRHNQEYEVPDFYGMQVEEACQIAAAHEFRLEVTDSVYVKALNRGAISRQNPAAGSFVKKGRRIILTINAKEGKRVDMPLLVGFSLRQARNELETKGLVLGKIRYTSDMATNNVLGQEYQGKPIPAGTVIPSESKITLILGQNASDGGTFIPDLTGYRYRIARDLVFDNSLNISACRYDETVTTAADSLSAMVYSQEPAPSETVEVPRGTGVTLHFTKDQSKIVRRTEEQEDEE